MFIFSQQLQGRPTLVLLTLPFTYDIFHSMSKPSTAGRTVSIFEAASLALTAVCVNMTRGPREENETRMLM